MDTSFYLCFIDYYYHYYFFSYWLVVLSVVLSQAIFSEALDRGHYSYGAHPSSLPAGGVNGAQRWPSFQQSPWSLYPRAPYRPISQLYPRWPNTDPRNLHVRWPNSRPSTPTPTKISTPTSTTVRPQVSNHHRVNRLRSLSSVDPKSGSLASTLQLRQPNQGWRTRKQWILPRKYFTSTSSRRGSTRTRTQPRGKCKEVEVLSRVFVA